MTIGEKAEDVFYVCDESGEALDQEALDRLKDALLARLDSQTS
jgi:UTP:GlnB (protein PII) uridylyltransferase